MAQSSGLHWALQLVQALDALLDLLLEKAWAAQMDAWLVHHLVKKSVRTLALL
jgi:hypothetical protein